MLVALSSFDIRIPMADSLKGKRHVVKSLTAGLRGKFNVAVAEVDHQDLRQRATLAVSAVAGEGYQLKKVMLEVARYIERQPEVELLEHRMTLHSQDD
ncbi:MAG TPA: DUF503 domain-containing protein [Actinomycetota bacterium]